MEDITEVFVRILHECDSTDIAEAQFKKMLGEDENLKENYAEWCHMNGSSFRNGFMDFAEEYLDSRNSIWDSLTDYDE